MDIKAVDKIKFVDKDNRQFFTTLKKRVNEHFEKHNKSKNANTEMKIKTVILMSMYIVPFVLLLTFQPPLFASLVLWIIMGFGVAGIGMSVMHDSIHGAYSANPNVNKWMGKTLLLLGSIPYNWKLQHNVLHHTYTNIETKDMDIQPKGGIRFSPHSAIKKHHRLQHIYVFVLYSLATIFWVIAKDFVQYFKFTREGLNKKTKSENVIFFMQIIALKIVYFSTFLVLPTVVLGIPFLHVLAGFLLMHLVAGITLSVVFQLAHTVEGTEFPLPNEKGIIENEWAVHQLLTTVNFSTDNKFLSWYVGGLNFQIEHHLFPKICHVHYKEIAPIVKQTAEEFGVPYMENKKFKDALSAHLALLHKFGRIPSMEDAIV